MAPGRATTSPALGKRAHEKEAVTTYKGEQAEHLRDATAASFRYRRREKRTVNLAIDASSSTTGTSPGWRHTVKKG
jgi:hypothetical protein